MAAGCVGRRTTNECDGGASGIIQMGLAPTLPLSGAFASEDPVLGHFGIGVSSNRYPYAWNNPVNRSDLNGRDVCAPTPFGDACAGDAAEDTWDATADPRDLVGVAGHGSGGWLSEAPGYLSDRSRDLVKEINFSTEEFIATLGTSAGELGICGAAGIGAGVVGTPAAGLWANRLCYTLEGFGAYQRFSDILDDEMRYRPKNSSDNPGTKAFEQGQRRVAPFIILGAVIAAILVQGASWIVLPVLLVVGAVYWLIVFGGARLILRIWQRQKGS